MLAAEDVDQLLVDDADDLLDGREALEDLVADRAFADVGDELLATLKLTSASRRAMRTSRIASSRSCSVTVPCLPSRLNAPESLSVRASNILLAFYSGDEKGSNNRGNVMLTGQRSCGGPYSRARPGRLSKSSLLPIGTGGGRILRQTRPSRQQGLLVKDGGVNLWL